MSRWMYLQGEIAYTGDRAHVDTFITGNDLPCGSEGPTTYSLYTDETANVIEVSIDGSLRDRGRRSDIDDVRRWFRRITKSGHTLNARVEIRTSGMFVCGLYFHDNIFTEINIPPGFIDLVDPD